MKKIFSSFFYISLAFLILGCSPSLKKVPYRTTQTQAKSWAEILGKPQPLKLTTMNTGIVAVEKTLLLNGDNPEFKQFKDDGSPLYVYSHLLRHPTKGDFLIDAGLDDSFAKNDSGNVRGLGWLWLKLAGITFSQNKGEDVVSQLSKYNVNLKGVFLTHMHVDHTPGLPALPGSPPVYMGPGESDDIFNIFDSGHLDTYKEINEVDFSRAKNLEPLGPAVDIFGDGSLWAIHTPGHTDGHLSFLVNSTDGAVLLTGDAIHMRWGYENNVGPNGGSSDRNILAERSLNNIKAFVKRFPDVKVILGHQRVEGKRI